jgi:hypothetical protein
MAQAVSRRSSMTDARFRSWVNLCGRQSGTGTGFSATGLLGFPPVSIIPPTLRSHRNAYAALTGRTNTNLPKSNARSEIRENCMEECVHIFRSSDSKRNSITVKLFLCTYIRLDVLTSVNKEISCWPWRAVASEKPSASVRVHIR